MWQRLSLTIRASLARLGRAGQTIFARPGREPIPHAGERGQMIVIVALAFVAIGAAIGLATDGAIVFLNRDDLASRADGAALAGGRELTNTTAATNKALQYLALHNITSADHTITITFSQTQTPNDTITVEVIRPTSLSFLNLVGISSVNVPASATAWAASWAADQTWNMFRGGPGRTGQQVCPAVYTPGGTDPLDPGIEEVTYTWGHRWNVWDTESHRSTPGILLRSDIHNGHAVDYVGSNGPNKSSADDYSGVYAWDTVDGTNQSLYYTAGGYNDALGNSYSNTLRSLGGNTPSTVTGVDIGGLLWYQPLDKISDVRSSPLVLDPASYSGSEKTALDSINGGFPIIFVTAHNGKVYALDSRDGDVIWQTANFNDERNSDGLYRSSPAYYKGSSETQGYIYQATSRGNVYKIDVTNGTIVWRSTPFPSDYTPAGLPAHMGSDPNDWAAPIVIAGQNGGLGTYTDDNVEENWGQAAIYGTVNVTNIPGLGDTVFVITHGKEDLNNGAGASGDGPFMFAINAADGSKRWEGRTFDGSAIRVVGAGSNDRNSAVVGNIDTNFDGTPDSWRVYAAPVDGYLYGFHASTGYALSDHSWATGSSPYGVPAPPSPEPGRVYTGAKSHRSDPDLFCDIIFGGNENAGMYAISAVTGDTIWDDIDSDGTGPDEVNPQFELNTSTGLNTEDCNSAAYAISGTNVINCWGARLMPGGVKSSPAVINGIVLVGTNQTSAGGNGGAVWALSTRTGQDLGHYDTDQYAADGGFGPTFPGSGSGDVRSGVVVGPDGKVYFGGKDGGAYQLFVTNLLILTR